MLKFPLVSVVITTKNEEKNIRKCLESVKNQTYHHDSIEIIVVDNNSTDKTQAIAKQYTNKVFNKGNERSQQRNFGAQKSSGTYYLYLDADMTLDKNILQEAVTLMESNLQLSALYIPEIVVGNNFWSQVRRFERSFYDATVIDCVRFVRMSAYTHVHGFDETMTGPEDWDFDKKIRQLGKTQLIRSPVYHNETGFTLRKYLKKKSYYAKSFSTYIAKWGKNDPDIKRQFGLLYRYLIVFTENGKWKKLIAHPILTIGMYLLRFFVGLNYVTGKK